MDDFIERLVLMAAPITSQTRQILVLANHQTAWGDLCARYQVCLTFCDTIQNAIGFAARTAYDLILIQFDKIAGNSHGLHTLRQSCPQARIVLLCSMRQEPFANKLLQERIHGLKTVDDYLLYPLGFVEKIKSFIEPSGQASVISAAAEQMIEQLERLATEDDLTHLKNRRYIRQFLTQILEYARTDNFHVTLLLFDIDNFKHYNDQYGHAVGDEVLYQVGQIMKRCCRSHDVVARVGGDEFAVVFWDLPSEVAHTEKEPERRKSLSEHPKETVFMSERFRLQLSRTKLSYLGASGKGHLTISGGLASFPKDGWDMKQLFEQADQAMLQAKRSGKNRIHIVGVSDDAPDFSNQTNCHQ